MKRIVVVALVLALLFCLTTAWASAPGSAGDPLISLTYINNTFIPTVRNDAKATITAGIGNVYKSAEASLQSAYDGYKMRLGDTGGYTFAGAFTPISLPAGTSAELITGSTFIMTAGSMYFQVVKGTLINISTGTETGSSGELTLRHRYFCAEDTTVQFIASTGSTCLIDGYYKSGGTVIINPVLFTDVRSTDWYYNAVSYASENKLFNGTSPTTFSPQTSMTRGMFVTVLYRLAKQPAVTPSAVFSDVPLSEYYCNPVTWANANNIVNGYSSGSFAPSISITREQMAVILYRYAVYAGYSTTFGNTTLFDSFPDNGSVSSYAVDAVKWANYNGIINGSGGKLLPQDTATRAQVAQILFNFCEKFTGV